MGLYMFLSYADLVAINNKLDEIDKNIVESNKNVKESNDNMLAELKKMNCKMDRRRLMLKVD